MSNICQKVSLTGISPPFYKHLEHRALMQRFVRPLCQLWKCIKMRNELTTCLFLIISTCVIAQKLESQIEITPFFRMDSYPEFSYVFSGRSSVDYVKMKGRSFGANIAYKIPLNNSVFIKPALGYYRFSFNNIRNENTSFGVTNSRIIRFPSPLYVIFRTDKYWYNTVSANFSIDKYFSLKKDIEILAGVNFNNFYSYSQYYHIVNNPGEKTYRRHYGRYFGHSSLLQGGLIKKFGKLDLGISILLPIYDTWKQDNIFPEESNSQSRNKWFRGISTGLTFNYLIKKFKT